MRINDNGIYRDMTQEELAEYYDVISDAQGGNALSPANTGVQTCVNDDPGPFGLFPGA